MKIRQYIYEEEEDTGFDPDISQHITMLKENATETRHRGEKEKDD